MKIQEKTIAVTGAGSGLGRELTLNLLSKNARVAAIDINEKGLKETLKLAASHKNNIATYVLDITNKKDVEGIPKKIMTKFDALDGLINNAGIIQRFVRVNDLDYTSIDRVMKINFFGALYMTKSFLPHLLKRPEAHIVNISSMGGFLPVPGQSIYGASKAAIKLLTEGLYAELKDTSVHVTVVFPGAMATNIATNSGIKLTVPDSQTSSMKTLSPDKAAQMIITAMQKNSFRVLVGSDASFMDFIYRLSPKFAANFIYKQMKSLLS